MLRHLKDWRILIGILLILAVVWAALTQKHDTFEATIKTAQAFSWFTILLCLILCTFQVLLMGLRMWALAPKKTDWKPVLWAVCYGQFANSFFPARAGEALKIAIMTDKKSGARLRLATTTGVFIGDKLSDLISLIAWIVISQCYKLESIRAQSQKLMVGFTCLIFLVCLFVYFAKRSPKLAEKIGEFKEGLKTLFIAEHFFPSLAFGILTWGCEILAFKLLVQNLGFDFGISQSVATLVFLNLAIAVPISIANVGPFEASVVYALKEFGVSLAPAMAIAAVHHMMQLGGTAAGMGIARLLHRVKSHKRAA